MGDSSDEEGVRSGTEKEADNKELKEVFGESGDEEAPETNQSTEKQSKKDEEQEEESESDQDNKG